MSRPLPRAIHLRIPRLPIELVLPALLALVVGLCGLSSPPLWRDEAATVSAALRSPGELLHLLRTVDAVHGVYYALMHLVVTLGGTVEVVVRLPSVVAGMLAAGGTGALGRALGHPRVGLYGGALLATMPIFSRYVQEARPYSLTMAVTIGATLLLLRAVRQRSVAAFTWYGMALVALAYVNVFALLVAGAHGAFVIWSRGPVVRWGQTVTLAVVAVLPLAVVASQQTGQIGWITRPDLADLGLLAVQLFGDIGNVRHAVDVWNIGDVIGRWWEARPAWASGSVLVGSLALLGITHVIIVRVRRVTTTQGTDPSSTGSASTDTGTSGSSSGMVSAGTGSASTGPFGADSAGTGPAGSSLACTGSVGTSPSHTGVAGTTGPGWSGSAGLVRLALPWLVLPPMALVTVSLLAHPVYEFRYVLCCVPAAALLAGAGLAALPRRVISVVFAVWIIAALPGQLSTRGPHGRQDNPRPVVALLASAARPGDGVLFAPGKVRKYTAVYPEVFGRLVDVALVRSPERDGSFAGRQVGPRALAVRLARLRTLWVVGHTGKMHMPRWSRHLTRHFVATGRWTFRGLFVVRYDASGSSKGAGVG